MKAQNNYSTGMFVTAMLVVIVLLSTLSLDAQDWFDGDWEYRREVTVNNTMESELTDFQVHITLDATFNFSNANSNGIDVRITENDGTTVVSFWIEYWDATGEQASVWVKVPTIPIAGTTLFLYYGNTSATSMSNGSATFEFFDDFEIDLTKWTASGGTWTRVQTTEQYGSTGFVAQGSTTGIQLLQSLGFSDTDYVLDGYGKHVGGRDWGLCTRVTGSQNFYLSMLYEDLDATYNLYLYSWTPSSHPSYSAAIGTINMNTWYKMTVKVYDDTISTYINDVEKLTVEDAQHTLGGIALLGNVGSLAHFNDIRVRKYALSDPISSIGSEEAQPSAIDIAIYHTTCGDFEARLRPLRNITNNYITNIQFTLKWPASTVNLTNFLSDYGVSLQGVSVENDTNYAVFVSASYSLINWTAGTEYTILTFSHDYSATGYADFEIDMGPWAAANYGEFYVELFGKDQTGIAYGKAENVYLGRCGEIKVLLQGPYAGSGMMSKGLSENIPLSQPYNMQPWNYGGTESVAVMDEAVVDWVLVELRSSENTIAEQKAALLLEDGHVVQYDNIEHGVHFTNTPDGSSYFIVIHHRNHMPVMTALSTEFDGSIVDFTDETICYGSPDAEIELETGICGMIAGDVTTNGQLQYSGPGNDRGPIIAKIVTETGSANINGFIIDGYWFEDVNMNDTVLFIGSNNDRSYINVNLNTLIGPELNNIYTSPVPGIADKSKPSTANTGYFDIQITESETHIYVEIVTNKPLKNGLVDNIQFTLAWKAKDADIEHILNTFSSDFMLALQGEITENNGINHLVFVSVTPVNLPTLFEAGEKVAILSIEKTTATSISERLWIADNNFTATQNGMYYISVWGIDNTGSILTTPLGMNGNPLNRFVSIYPNPVHSGKVKVEIRLTNTSNVIIEVLDVRGEVTYSQKMNINGGISNIPLELNHLSNGIYFIRIQADSLSVIQKLILL